MCADDSIFIFMPTYSVGTDAAMLLCCFYVFCSLLVDFTFLVDEG